MTTILDGDEENQTNPQTAQGAYSSQDADDSVDGVGGLVELLGIRQDFCKPGSAGASFTITDELRQHFGFLHGGATITLLETTAGLATEQDIDLDTELAFGTHIDIHLVKAGKNGCIRGVATMKELPGTVGSTSKPSRIVWDVTAYDDDGEKIAVGEVTYHVISRSDYKAR